jgi:HK97 family phage prohead protease
MSKIENRHIAGVELRAGGGKGKPDVISGFIPYNTRSVDLGGFVETIKPGAFGDTTVADVRGRYNHDLILGRSKAGTLKLTPEAGGMRYEITPQSSDAAAHVIESVRRGDVTGSSFAFRTITDEWRMEDGQPLRELVSVELLDVGPVDFPAYPDSMASARGVGQVINSQEFREHVARKIAELKQKQTGTPHLDAARVRLAEV